MEGRTTVRRTLAVLMASACLLGLSTAQANASSFGCAQGGVKGLVTDFNVCFNIKGKGTHVDLFRVGADDRLKFKIDVGVGDDGLEPGVKLEDGYEVPELCEVHANVRNSDRSFSVDSPAKPCKDLESISSSLGPGAENTFEFPINRDLPPGKYCGILWFKFNGEYYSGGAACNNVEA
jgi:hypothetical protein